MTSQSSSQSPKRSHPSSSRSSTVGKTAITTPYSAEFEQKMIDKGVFPEGYEDADGNIIEPENLDDIRKALGQVRGSLSPSCFSDSAFAEFRRDNRRAQSESNVIATMMPVIAGSQDAHYYSCSNVVFNRVQKFDPDISSAKPDVYYGARPNKIDPRVRQELGQYIVPSSQQTRPAAPNFFFESKSASGKPDMAQRQAMYDGALGARSMLHLQNYRKVTTVYDGNAYSLSSTYHPGTGTLQMYATHPRQSSPAGETDYYMTQVDAYTMTHSSDSFRSGGAAYRNARSWNEEQRNHFIANANTTAQSISLETTSSRLDSAKSSQIATQESSSSETSEDEIAREALARRKQRRG